MTDKERLDWLEKNVSHLYARLSIMPCNPNTTTETARQILDSKISKQDKRAKNS